MDRAAAGVKAARLARPVRVDRNVGATHLKVYAAGDSPAEIVALMRRWLDTVGPAVEGA